MAWDRKTAEQRIQKYLKEVDDLEYRNLRTNTDLDSIPLNRAYVGEGVHVYANIPNFKELLETTSYDGERGHRRALRFLDLYQRALDFGLREVDVVRVDFHAQRLHAVSLEPQDDEEMRVRKAVAVAAIAKKLIETGNLEHQELPNAKVRIGIDTGTALAIRNGRKGNREPLFLGDPANQAAKFAEGEEAGIYLSNLCREIVGLNRVANPANVPLSRTLELEIIRTVIGEWKMERLSERWEEELEIYPQSRFEFSRPRLPISNLKFDELSPSNSRRLEAVCIYVDISGFTKFVRNELKVDPVKVARTMHVLRSELQSVLTDFDGRRVRYVGDCIQGLIVEGTDRETRSEESVSTAVLCAGAMRDSFDLVCRALGDDICDALGLAIGFEYGPIALTRLGLKGRRLRCAVGRSCYHSEEIQQSCAGRETACGDVALDNSSAAVKALFSENPIKDLSYARAIAELEYLEDATAKAEVHETRIRANVRAAPAAIAAARPHVKF